MRTARRWTYSSEHLGEPFIFHVDVNFYEDILGLRPITIRFGNVWQGNTSSDFMVDWGDGTRTRYAELSATAGYIFHTYSNDVVETKRFLIKVYATKLSRAFYTTCLTAVSYSEFIAVGVSGSMPLFYDEDTAAAESVHSPLFGLNSTLQFISEELFYRNPQITDFSYAFGSSQISEIPENLFARNPDAVSFHQTFQYGKIVSIPPRLFANNPLVVDFVATFSICRNISSIPEDLFVNNPLVTDFDNVFSSCIGVSIIPPGLFRNNPLVTTFRSAFLYIPIEEIPSELFKNNPLVTSFNMTFDGCTNLKTVPSDVFSGNMSVINFARCFYDCTGIISSVPTLWTRGNVTSYGSCFYGCTSAANYAAIPAGWK